MNERWGEKGVREKEEKKEKGRMRKERNRCSKKGLLSVAPALPLGLSAANRTADLVCMAHSEALLITNAIG
jgi:hypothetical protein